jgi:hypothetical protein
MTFNEPEYLKLIFLLADTQQWLNNISKQAIAQLPISEKKNLFRKSYYLTIETLTHIIERHYYKIPRHPDAGKFHIPLPDILHHIREAYAVQPIPVAGCNNLQRIVQTEQPVGFDKNGQQANHITILTDTGGKIITAFPGLLESSKTHAGNTILFSPDSLS